MIGHSLSIGGSGGINTPAAPHEPLAGYSAWFDAGSLVYEDVAAATPSVGDGAVVMRWDSKGGTYGALACTTPGGYGACHLSALPGGRQAVRSTAAGTGVLRDAAELASIPGALLSAAGATVFAVVYRASSEPGASGVWGANDNAMTCAYDTAGGPYGLRNYLNDGGFQSAPILAAPNSGAPRILTWHHAGGRLYSGVDDTRDGSMVSVAAGNVVGGGALLVLLGYAGPAGYFDGDAGEFLFYPTPLTQSDRILVERYLAWKYSLTLPY